VISDIFIAQSKAEDALVGPLHTITYVSSDPENVHVLLTEGMDMEASAWHVPEGDEKRKLDAYFGFDASDKWKARRYFKSGIGDNVQLRLIAVDKEKPQTRPEVSGAYLGGLSIGYPMINTDAREARMTDIGYPSVVGVKRLEFSSPEGETYVSEEVHFTGPENVYILGVKRPDIFVPVGPIDNTAEIGGPAYSALCVSDCDASIAFYKDILGYEIRRDMAMMVGDKSGLKLREGSYERFVQAFAPGANTGYLVLLDHGDEYKPLDADHNFGPPSRGVAMWSFPCTNLEEVRRRAVAEGVQILQPLGRVKSPFLPDTNTLIIADPGGYPVEIYAV